MRKPHATAAAAALFCTRIVHGQTLPNPDIDCTALDNPLFIEAGDTQMKMLGDVARYLRDAEVPVTLVYLPRSTCTLTENVFSKKNTTEVMRYVPSLAQQATWDGVPRQCNNVTGGIPIDVGIAATFTSSCSESVLDLQPADVAIVRGPVQGYGFVVPDGVADSVKGITREEAFFVFSGQGLAANALPWTAEPNPVGGTPSLFIRRDTTSTLLTLAANVAPELLPASQWVGYRLDGQLDRSSNVIAGVSAAKGTALEEQTLGLLGLDLYDRARDQLDVLAYQAKDQRFGYYPDSTPTARDKRNVRDGHYVPWGYTEYLVQVDGNGDPVSERAALLLDVVRAQKVTRIKSGAGVSPAFDLDAMEIVATNGLIPECAMGVQREYDGGELSLYTPAASCACFFEAVQDPSLLTDPPTTWAAACPVCETTSDCSGSAVCRRGFCEVK